MFEIQKKNQSTDQALGVIDWLISTVACPHQPASFNERQLAWIASARKAADRDLAIRLDRLQAFYENRSLSSQGEGPSNSIFEAVERMRAGFASGMGSMSSPLTKPLSFGCSPSPVVGVGSMPNVAETSIDFVDPAEYLKIFEHMTDSFLVQDCQNISGDHPIRNKLRQLVAKLSQEAGPIKQRIGSFYTFKDQTTPVKNSPCASNQKPQTKDAVVFEEKAKSLRRGFLAEAMSEYVGRDFGKENLEEMAKAKALSKRYKCIGTGELRSDSQVFMILVKTLNDIQSSPFKVSLELMSLLALLISKTTDREGQLVSKSVLSCLQEAQQQLVHLQRISVPENSVFSDLSFAIERIDNAASRIEQWMTKCADLNKYVRAALNSGSRYGTSSKHGR